MPTSEPAACVDVSIIVPVMDEVDSLEQLSREIHEVLGARHSVDQRGDWEVIFVDDGSADGSWETIQRLAATSSRVAGLRFRRNVGKTAALAAGLEASTGSVIVTMDGDLQDDPREVPKLLARLDEGADLVSGYKKNRQDPLTKRIPSRIYNAVTGAVTGLRLRDHNCGLKVGRREVFEDVMLYGEMHRYIAVIAHTMGYVVVDEPVVHRPREHGVSKFGNERYVRGALDLLTVVTLTRYGRRPAHFFGGLGIVVGLVGAAILLYLSALWFLTDAPIGDRPLLLLGALLVILSVQLASVGLLAELIIRRDAAAESPSRHVVERTRSPGRFAA